MPGIEPSETCVRLRTSGTASVCCFYVCGNFIAVIVIGNETTGGRHGPWRKGALGASALGTGKMAMTPTMRGHRTNTWDRRKLSIDRSGAAPPRPLPGTEPRDPSGGRMLCLHSIWGGVVTTVGWMDGEIPHNSLDLPSQSVKTATPDTLSLPEQARERDLNPGGPRSR